MCSDSSTPKAGSPPGNALTERELQLTIQAVKDALNMNMVLRQGDPIELERIIEKLESKTDTAVQAYADNLNRKMGRSRGNE